MFFLQKIAASGTLIGLIAYVFTGISILFFSAGLELFVDRSAATEFLNYYAIVGFLSYVASFGQQFNLLRVGSEEKKKLKKTGTFSTPVFEKVALVGGFQFLLSPLIFGLIYHLLHGGDVFKESFFLALAVILQSQVRIFSQFLIGTGQFEIVAKAQIIRALSIIVLGFIGIRLEFETFDLASLFLFSEAFTVCWLIWANWKRFQIIIFPRLTIKNYNIFDNVSLMIGDVTYEFGPKIQIILASYFLTTEKQHLLVYSFLAVEIFIQVAMVFRNKFNSVFERFAANTEATHAAFRVDFLRAYRLALLGLIALATISLLVSFVTHHITRSQFLLLLCFLGLLYALYFSNRFLLLTNVLILHGRNWDYFRVNASTLTFNFGSWIVLLPIFGVFTPVISFGLTVALNVFIQGRLIRKANLAFDFG